MGSHYIVLSQADRSIAAPHLPEEQLAFLGTREMRAFPMDGPVRLFISEDTPVLAVPGGVVLGHLFSKEGLPARADKLQTLTSVECLSRHLLDHYWGDYLLIQTALGPAPGFRILREPSGGVPCIYSFEGSIGFVTSDISLATGLGVHRQQIDWGFISRSLAYPHVNSARTALASVQELLPGCSLTVSGAGTTIREAWSPWALVADPHRHHDPAEAALEIRTAVDRVVKAWAKTDEAVLVELSGGLDSSIVAMCLQGTQARVACCTLVTPVPGADERRYAHQVADSLGVKLHAEELRFADAHFDFEPPVQTAKPRVSVLQHVTHGAMESVAGMHGTTSFFSGGGGDTVFCYSSGAAPAADAFIERGLSPGLAAIRDLSDLHGCTHWKSGRLTLRKLLRGARVPCKPNPSFLDPSIAALDLDIHPWFEPPPGILPGDQERIADLAGTQVFRDSAPRSSTHWLRLPLLSQPVVEACLKAPSWMWIAGGENRALARQAFVDRLPQGILERRSKGTFISFLGAIYHRRKFEMREYLLGGHLQSHRLLDTPALEALFKATPPPRDTSFVRAFDLCMIENWIRHTG